MFKELKEHIKRNRGMMTMFLHIKNTKRVQNYKKDQMEILESKSKIS